MLCENRKWDDMMKCERCGADMSGDDSYEYAGRTLCEDCCLDIKAAPKACNPWAVFTAKKRTAEQSFIDSRSRADIDTHKKGGSLVRGRDMQGLEHL